MTEVDKAALDHTGVRRARPVGTRHSGEGNAIPMVLLRAPGVVPSDG